MEKQNIQWYPGHMTKTRRQMQTFLPLIDAVLEITDARIPLSGRNPDLDEITRGKRRLVLMNKADAADEKITAKFLEYFKSLGTPAFAADCRSGQGINKFLPLLKELLADKLRKYEQKGLVGKPLRVMVVGIPNVGKSSFINRMGKSAGAKVEDRPGVTRGSQWFAVDKRVELLDTPGVLWPKFDDEDVALKLAFTGAVKDSIMDIEALACRLLEMLAAKYPHLLSSRYRLPENFAELRGFELLDAVGAARGMRISGGEINTERAAVTVLDEFRSAKIGRITLDEIPQY